MTDDPFSHLVISRKRKKYKFAHFDSFKNCFTHGHNDDPLQLRVLLKPWLKNKNVTLELAAGNAQFSLELARRHPERSYIAADIKSDRLYTSAKQALVEGVTNIAFVRMNMQELTNVFEKASIDEIWLTFPDPFSRKRSVRRRLTHPQFLQQYEMILKETGTLKFKTDNLQLFQWSLEQFVEQKWHINELTFDLHESDIPNDSKIMTHYELRYHSGGVPINYGLLTK